MSSKIIVPFNYQPVLTTVVTASYTVPLGKYVRVLAEVTSGGQITINGVAAVTTSPFINVDVNIDSTSAASYTVPSNYKATFTSIGVEDIGLNPTFWFNGNTFASINFPANGRSPSIFGSTVGPAGSISTGASSNTVRTKQIAGLAEPANATHRQAEFWIPSGTVLSGSGTWRAIITEYNEIS